MRGTHVFGARRIGPRVLLVEPNDEFRAITDNTAKARAVRDALALPENTEVEAMPTFTSDRPGKLVSGVAATRSTFTVRQHHSFIQLPGPANQPRVADPRFGVNGPTARDSPKPLSAVHKRVPDRCRVE